MTIQVTCSCGAPMVVRELVTQAERLTCSRYPDCTETRPLPEDVKMRRAGAAQLPGFSD